MSNRDQGVGPRLGRAKLGQVIQRLKLDEGGFHHPKCDCAVQTPCLLCDAARDLLAFAQREREDVHEESCDSSTSHCPKCEALTDLIEKATGRK